MFKKSSHRLAKNLKAVLSGGTAVCKPPRIGFGVFCGILLGGSLILMLNAAMTGILVRALTEADRSIRIVVSSGFLAFLALITLTAYTAYSERKHELRLAHDDEKRQLYYRLTDTLFSVLDTYDNAGHYDPQDLILFLRQYRTEWLTYGAPEVLEAADRFLQASCAGRSRGLKPCFFKDLEKQTIDIINLIKKDLGEASFKSSVEGFFRCTVSGGGPKHPALRRYK
jgi:hypothetical protein